MVGPLLSGTIQSSHKQLAPIWFTGNPIPSHRVTPAAPGGHHATQGSCEASRGQLQGCCAQRVSEKEQFMSQAHGNSFHLGQTGAGPNPPSGDAVREITEVPLPVDPHSPASYAHSCWHLGRRDACFWLRQAYRNCVPLWGHDGKVTKGLHFPSSSCFLPKKLKNIS